jgi:hypothetical protein
MSSAEVVQMLLINAGKMGERRNLAVPQSKRFSKGLIAYTSQFFKEPVA